MTPALDAAYAEPHRRYHTRAHIEACLARLGEVTGLTEADHRTLQYAIWWHDAVYDPRRDDNEARSADLARLDLAEIGADEGTIEEVSRLILLTKGHAAPPGDRLGALMVGIDLAILGAPPAAYDAYAAAIRQEYAHVPDDAFKAGRRGMLQAFADSPQLFADPGLRARFEDQARVNLAREIASLG